MNVWSVPGGERLVAIGEPSKVGDLFTRRKRIAHSGNIQTFCVNSTGRLLATGGSDRLVMLWDIPSGTRLAVLGGHTFDLCMVAFVADDEILLSVALDGSLRAWQVPSGQQIMSVDLKSRVNALAISPDGRQLAVGARKVRIFEIPTGRPLPTRDESFVDIHSLAFSPSADLLAVGTFVDVRLWDLRSSQEVATFRHRWHVRTVAFNNDGTMLASVAPVTVGSNLHVMEVPSGVSIKRFDRADLVVGATFFDDAMLILLNGGVRVIIDPTSGQEVTRFTHVNHASPSTVISAHGLIATVGKGGPSANAETIFWGPA